MVDDAGLLLYASAGLLLVAALLSEILTERDARHRPVCIALALLSVCMIVRLALHEVVLHGGPYTGWARAAFHVEQFTRLVTAMVPAWLAWTALGRKGSPLRPSVLAAGCVVGGWLMLVTSYPDMTGDTLRRGYLATEVVSLALAGAAIFSWMRRRGWRRDDAQAVAEENEEEILFVPNANGLGRRAVARASIKTRVRAHTWLAVLMVCAADAALLFVGAWPRGLFGAAYRHQQAGLVALFGALVVLHAIALRFTRRSA